MKAAHPRAASRRCRRRRADPPGRHQAAEPEQRRGATGPRRHRPRDRDPAGAGGV